jgi:hypothetical protein
MDSPRPSPLPRPTLLRLSELRLPLDHSPAELEAAILRRLRLPPAALLAHRLVKRSVDARRPGSIQLVYSLDLELAVEGASVRQLRERLRRDPQLRPSPDERYRFVVQADPENPLPGGLRPLVMGAGPCGYFAALLLAQMGLRPLLLERGKAVRERSADTFGFWRGQRRFDPESNVQFGEGGAGTFSDGKLYSQISEPAAYGRKVLEELVAAGANPEILTLHHPHIGTFKLATVVRGLRARIEALGGEVRFCSRVTGLDLEPLSAVEPRSQLRGVVLADGTRIAANHLVLAVGHSARDSFAMLRRLGVALQAKPFAVGVRIEHPQGLIDRCRWGAAAGHPRLGAAEYKLVHHCAPPAVGPARDVYSFCMCPGGLVVGATSEEGCVVTNGMSQHSRNERNANSGLVVNVTLEDLAAYGEGPGDPLAGVAFQRHWERRAFEKGGGDYHAPAQWLEDFLVRRSSAFDPQVGGFESDGGAEGRDDCGAEESGEMSAAGRVKGSYLPGVRLGSLDGCLPEFVLEAIREALPEFDRRIQGFCMPGALITGIETRTSSPVRIPRDSLSLESLNVTGLYPAGEGAGYAGGILSAAIDGLKVAEALALNLLHPQRQGAQGGSACDPA